MSTRVGKYKLLAWTGKYKLEARVGKYKLGVRAGKYKLGVRTGGKNQGRGSSKRPMAGKYKDPLFTSKKQHVFFPGQAEVTVGFVSITNFLN